MAYQIEGCKDPITASTRLPQYSTKNVNYLANSGSRQPYQKLSWNNNYLPLSLANVNYNLGGYNNMGCCGGFNTVMNFYPMLRGGCGGNTGTVNFFMPSYSSCGSGNQTLFNLNFGGDACSYSGGFGNYGMSYCGTGYSPLMAGLLGGGYNLMGGFLPFGSGSYSDGFTNTAYSDRGYATTNPFGSSVVSYGGGKSHAYNLGALGSYASGSGGRALNILGGLYSETRSNGNTNRDFSGLVNLALGTLFA